jgi:hypothetical protein
VKPTAYELQPWPTGRYARYRARNNCHPNASRLAQDHPSELILVKGYARTDLGIWVGHWWCVDREVRVVDPTWRNSGVAYVGLGSRTVQEDAWAVLEAGCWDVDTQHRTARDVGDA